MNKLWLFRKAVVIGVSSLIAMVLMKVKGISFNSFIYFDGVPVLYRQLGSEITLGKKIRINSRPASNLIGIKQKSYLSTLKSDAKLSIGNGTGLSGVSVSCFKSISIGKNCKIGANTVITDSDWHEEDKRSGAPKSISIGDDVWIGYGCIILKGVTIGQNTIIGAGSVVVKSIPANSVAAGNPCRVIKQLVVNE